MINISMRVETENVTLRFDRFDHKYRDAVPAN